ncbi:GntR family transcriptional regulator [Marinactinospora endophytica]
MSDGGYKVVAMAAKYEEIADELRQRIKSGEYAPGTTLPSYEQMSSTYSVGSGVIRQALEVLKAEGLISVAKKRGITVRERGSRRRIERGSLVTRDPARGYIFSAAASATEPWQTHGRPRRDTVPITDRPAELLGITPGELVLRRRRVTSPTGEPPFQLVDTWIHPDAVADAPQVGDAHTGRGGYLDRLEEVGHGPLTWTEYTRVRMPSPEEARLVDMPDAMPVLEIARVGVSARTGRPVEATVCVIPADRVELVTKLRRAKSARWGE